VAFRLERLLNAVLRYILKFHNDSGQVVLLLEFTAEFFGGSMPPPARYRMRA
jgi:hypothetical protein